MPIYWFGNMNDYMESKIRIITVGLNPSDKEFREKDTEPFCSNLRFPDFKGDCTSLMKALNRYFDFNPYSKWFDSGFEPILNGMDASYYSDNTNKLKGKEKYTNKAVHTDFCSPWATEPTWSKLSILEKDNLLKEGIVLWVHLVKLLSPDIILFSLPHEILKKVGIRPSADLCEFPLTKDGQNRSKPEIIKRGIYDNSLTIFGTTVNNPYGLLGKVQKNELGVEIIKFYNTIKP